MALANKERVLVTLLREIAAEQKIQLTSFSQDWILRLESGGRARHVFGYNFELNSATAELIAGDKAAISDLLANQDIPRVEHKLFLHPRLAGYVSEKGNFANMLAYAGEHGFPLVIKPNEGTGGEDVTRVDNVAEMEQSAIALFQVHRAICLSAYLDIEQEYRALMLDEECELLYAKRRPHVIGDGKSSVLELIEKLHLQGLLTQNQAAQAIDQHRGDLKQVPDRNQEVIIGWKHNLGEGSAPSIVEEGPLRQELVRLAKQTQAAINIRFASIDIVQVEGQKFVLEVNSGVMMEYFVRHFDDGRRIAKKIYAKAVDKMFAS
ncbi:MAG: ATP-grasp domain-containing protein [Anaerolineales bacterium]